MKNCTLLNGKNLALAMFFLFFALGGVAQTGTTSKTDFRASTPPQFLVMARYAPDASYSHSASVKVHWGSNIYDFESNAVPFSWTNDSVYPWVVASPEITGYYGDYCLKSGNAGVANSNSAIEATVYFVQDGSVSFRGGCWGEGTYTIYDQCRFFIDSVEQFNYGALQSWDNYSYEVSQGYHTFKWSYTKDSSENPTGDAFFVDDVVFAGIAGIGSDALVSSYNIYRRVYNPEATTGGEISLIAENVTGNQYQDEAWADLEAGTYQYGVAIPNTPSLEVFWSDPITKSTVDYFSINVSANSTNGGTVSGGGTSFTYGQTCTLTAEANDRYHFVNWTINDTVVVGSNTSYTFTVTESADYVANFEPDEYYAWLSSNIQEGGTYVLLCQNDTVYYVHLDDTVTLKATPSDGYGFMKWTAEGSFGRTLRGLVELSTEPEYTFVIDNDFLDAVFEGGSPWEGRGKKSGEKSAINDGDGIEFTAYFKPECTRPTRLTTTDIYPDGATLRWTENGTSESWVIFCYPENLTSEPEPTMFEVEENPYTITDLEANTTYQAFVVPSCGIQDGIPNSNMVSDTLTFTTLESCPTPQHVEVDSVAGTTATITWDDYSENYYVQLSPVTFMLSENFENEIPETWQNSTNYPWTVVDGYIQSGNAGVGGSTSSISLTMTFPADGNIEFDAECMGEGLDPSIYDFGSFKIDDSVKFKLGTTDFGWCHYSYNVPAGEHIFTWLYSKDGSVNPDGDYLAVDNVVLRTDDMVWGDSISVEDPRYTFTGLTPLSGYAARVLGVCGETITNWSNPVFFATTDAESYEITVVAVPEEGGTVNGGGTYNQGDTCTLTAMPNYGYHFLNWLYNEDEVSTNPTYQFTVIDSGMYVANFELNSYLVAATAVPEAGGTVTGAGTYN